LLHNHALRLLHAGFMAVFPVVIGDHALRRHQKLLAELLAGQTPAPPNQTIIRSPPTDAPEARRPFARLLEILPIAAPSETFQGQKVEDHSHLHSPFQEPADYLPLGRFALWRLPGSCARRDRFFNRLAKRS